MKPENAADAQSFVNGCCFHARSGKAKSKPPHSP